MAIVPEAAVIGWCVIRSRGRDRELGLKLGVAYVAGWALFSPWLAVLPRQQTAARTSGTYPD
jgi:4-amino-4-deoxy-L-arabinose transferase-like glycosyltransferase